MAGTPPPDTDAPPPAGTTQAVPAPRNDRPTRTFPCEGCGAELEFNIGAQSLKCPYCGHVKALDFDPDAKLAEQDFAATLKRLSELREGARPEAEGLREIHCESCGAIVRFVGTLTSSECAYCGVALQLDQAHDAARRVPADGVLPFLVSREQARTNLCDWVRSLWFAPNDFKARGAQGRFNGVYLPYWTFDSATATHYVGQRGEYYWVTVGSGKNRRRERRTRWYHASGTFERFFDDVLVVAATGLPHRRLVGLEPWPLTRCVPFNPEVLAGFLARTYDVPLDEGFLQAKARMQDALVDDVRERIGGDEQRISSINTRFNAITYKHLLLPVWMLAYRFREKSYQVVVNAGTGEVQGDRPYSWIKIALAVLAAVVVGGLAGYVLSQMQ